jgi:hypothetical protein
MKRKNKEKLVEPKSIVSKKRNKQIGFINNAAKKPHTRFESTTHELINRFNYKHGISTKPHPMHTHNVIYCVYAENTKHNTPVYIGQTTNTAHWRLEQEIRESLSLKSNTPISNFIKHTGRYNMRVIALQHVKNWEESHYWERYWIHKFASHVQDTRGTALNVNNYHKPICNT